MCGLAGILKRNKESLDDASLHRMLATLLHRGPDGQGYFVDRYLGLAHARLAIVDLSEAANQPMHACNDRYTMVYVGEVYNHAEIKKELLALGYDFQTHSDTEVVLKAYAEWKEDCFIRFNGMFACALWDKQEELLVLARDRYGIKPLYYTVNHGAVIFASEIKAILASGAYHSDLDVEGLFEYLTFQNFFTDKTLFKDIQLLEPGHFLKINASGIVAKKQYWDFDFSERLKISREEAVEELNRLFHQAVQRHLISDVPVNAYLSGGIDSGAITMVASRYLPNMKTFTVGFDLRNTSLLEKGFDERDRAEYISHEAGTEQYEMVLKAGDMERILPSLVHHLEEPRVGQSYPNYYAAQLASKFGKVVLSGAGGDELFAGYPWRYFYSSEPMSYEKFIEKYYLKWQRLMPAQTLRQLLPEFSSQIKDDYLEHVFSSVFKRIKKPILKDPSDFINFSLYLEAKTFLPGLLVVEDKLSMAHGLEARVPFLDNDLVAFASALPLHLKMDYATAHSIFADENAVDQKRQIKKNIGKKILRTALSSYVPKIITQAKKQGFSAPDASWFKNEKFFYFENLPQFFDRNTMGSIVQEHVKGEKNNRLCIWSLIYLNQFFKEFVL